MDRTVVVPSRPLAVSWGLLVFAFWPVWRWYVGRLVDGADGKWGALALVVVAAVAWTRSRGGEAPPRSLAAVVGLYAASYCVLPPLGRALVAVLALALLLSRSCRGPHLSLAGLLVLSLPVEATAQLLLGYPLRLAVASSCAYLLRGLGVVAQGTSLHWAGETVLVDAPCSGLRMLSMALLLGLTLAVVQSLRAARTVLVVVASVLAALAANVLRAAALFFKETGWVALPSWAHEGIGVAAFGAVALVILRVVGRQEVPPPPRVGAAGARVVRPVRGELWALAGAALAAALAPLAAPAASPIDRGGFTAWPAELDGQALVPHPIDARAARWSAAFPGRLAAFTSGGREVLVRWVPGPTRRLHPSADCYRGLGYETRPLPARRDGSGALWGCVLARRGPQSLRVCERVTSDDGQSFSDTSSWYWSALLGRSRGPYWATTVAEVAQGRVKS